MRYCIVDGAFIAAVWTCQTSEDFEFHHNVIANSEYVWMRKPGDRQTVRTSSDCALIDNKHFSGYGVASGAIGETGPEVHFERDRITTEGRFEFASYERTYLAADSTGHHLNAGLFQER